MKLLRLTSYYCPENISSLHLDKDIEEECSRNGIIQEIFAPTPTRGINDEERQKYKKLKLEKKDNGRVLVHRFFMMKERRNPFLRALRYLLINFKHYHFGIKVKDIDIVYCASTPPTQGLTCAKIAKKLSRKYKRHVPFIYNLQDVFPDSLVKAGLTKEGSLLWKMGRRIENRTYAAADKIIVISEDFKRNIMAKGVPEEKIEVVYNWIDTEKVKPVDRKDNKLFDEYFIDRNDFIVVYAGNFGVSQGVKVVIDAAALLKDKNNIKFVLFGGGAEYEKIKNYAESLNLSNVMINPLLSSDRISEVYSMGDVELVVFKSGAGKSAMPSKTWSIMACNAAIIASFDTDSELAKVIENAKCGVCIEPENAIKLSETIKYFYALKKKGAAYKTYGRKFVEENASKLLCVNRYLQVFKDCLEKNE